ncbi:MAG: PAS domain S-box protein [Candidatus Hydrogenedentes bacterium]|nr:PAS domain S-box protein [Candidatus Hydrogenedentota bacterium]
MRTTKSRDVERSKGSRQVDVLIADDDSLLLKMLSRELIDKGFTCSTAIDGHEALTLLLGEDIDAALIDLDMPGLDGFGVLAAIQQQEINTIPIVLTGTGNVSAAVKAMKLGAFDFLEKPCNPELLAHAIRRAREYREAKVAWRRMRDLAEEWQATFDASPDPIIALDFAGRIIRCNRTAANIAGVDVNLLNGRKCHEALCGTPHSLAECPFTHHLQAAGPLSTEHDMWNGVFEFSSAPLLRNDGEAWGCLIVARDRMRHKLAERALRESEQRYRTLFMASRDAIMTLEPPSWRFTSANQACLDVFGCREKAEFVALGLGDLSPETQPDGRQSVEMAMEMIQKALNAGSHFFEWRHKRLGGEEFPATVLLTRTDLGDRTILQATVRDITEQRKHADDLRESEEKFRVMTNAAQDAILMMDGDGRITFYNSGAESIFGWTAGEVLGKDLHALLAPEQYRANYEAGMAHFRNTGQGQAVGKTLELTALRKNGLVFPIEISLSGVQVHGDWHAVGVIRDISARKLVEQNLQDALGESCARERQVAMLLKSARAILDCESFIESARQVFDACREVTGATAGYVALLSGEGEENEVLFLESGGAFCSVDPSLPMPIRGLRAEAYRLKCPVFENDFSQSEWVKFMPDGHVSLRNVLFAPLMLNDKAVGLLGLSNKDGDFTEEDARLAAAFGQQASVALRNVRSRDALRASEEKVRQIVDNISLGVSLIGPDMRIIEVNRKMREWFPDVEPGQLSVSHRAVADTSGDADPASSPIAATLADGHTHEATLSLHVNGETRSYRLVACPVHNSEGDVVSVIKMMDDITERRRLEQELGQAQKLEAVGRLAAGIAHEINTPTQYVGDNIEFLRIAYDNLTALIEVLRRMVSEASYGSVPSESLSEAKNLIDSMNLDYLVDQIPKAIEQSIEGVGRVSSIVQAMKEFSHPGTAEKVQVDLNQCIRSTVTVSRNEWKYVADLYTELDESLPCVLCLPGEFNQVILNMIVNAAHAIGEVVGDKAEYKGRITVSTQQKGNWAEVRISDTGAGIPKDILGRIFDPFFTTKGVGRGTGQGLAIARNVIVDKHGGTITVESEVGKGSTFIIRLPIHAPQADVQSDDTSILDLQARVR